MGSSFSSESGPNRNTHHHYHRPHHPPPYYPAAPPPQPPYFHHTSSPQPPLPPPNTNYGYASSNPYHNSPTTTTTTTAPPPNNYYGYASSNPYPNPYPTTTTQYNYNYPPPIPSNQYNPGWQNSFNYPNPLMGRPNYAYSYGGHGNGWPPMGPPMNAGPPPLYVDHQNAKVVKNDVNVHKGTIKLEIDENYPDHHLVSFVFDARFDGSNFSSNSSRQAEISRRKFQREGVGCVWVAGQQGLSLLCLRSQPSLSLTEGPQASNCQAQVCRDLGFPDMHSIGG
ncbi:hypothetical protein Cgig2_016573 [Carnegiea gigantea]|uniref:MGRN1/RNF157-like N-terminal domain-containing protein n=1 Tax=Carnegiea gigantea TaxID=171969 RepID=A0A9Q1QRL7_9CARY|nr:hypothetical protein Cgig2_016573 [Carnegiea gigantea]